MTRVALGWTGMLLTVALSGCLSGSDSGDDGSEALAGATGSLEGTVLTIDQLPMRGVRVTVVGIDDALTGLDGSWRLDNVTTGDVVITAAHPGHQNATAFATIHPDEVTSVEIIMEPAPVKRVYHDSLLFDARIACEVAVGTNAEDTQWHACPTGEVANDQHRDFELEPELIQIVAEAQWDSSTLLADRLTFILEDRSRGLTFVATQMRSPAKIVMSPDVATKFYFDDGGHIQITIRSAPAQDDANVAGVGMAASQDVTFMLTAFYGAPAEPDFTALA